MPEVELPEEGQVDASAGQQDDREGAVGRDVHRDLVFDGESAVLVLVELFVEGDQFHRSAETADGSVDLDVPVVALVVDVLDKEPKLLVDVAVTAGVGVDLVQPAHPLRQVAAALLEESRAIVVLLLVERDGRVGVNDAGELVAVRGFPLGQDDDVVFACFQSAEEA